MQSILITSITNHNPAPVSDGAIFDYKQGQNNLKITTMLSYLLILLAITVICRSIKKAFTNIYVPTEEEEKTWNVWANESTEPKENSNISN